MKLHIVVDSKAGLVRSAVASGANAHDKHPLPNLLQGVKRRVYGNRGYQGCPDIINVVVPHARDFTHWRVRKPDSRLLDKRIVNNIHFVAFSPFRSWCACLIKGSSCLIPSPT